MNKTKKNTVWDDQAVSVKWTGTVLEINADCEYGPAGMSPAQTLGLIDFLVSTRDEVAAAADAQTVAHLWRAAADAAVDLHPNVVRIDRGTRMFLAEAAGMDLEDARRCLILVLHEGADLPPGEVKVYRSATNDGSEWRYVQYGPGLWVESYHPHGAQS